MYTLAFWKATFERVIFTAAEVLLALMTADGFGVIEFTTPALWSVVGLAAGAAVLKSIIAALGTGNPSVGNVETTRPGRHVA